MKKFILKSKLRVGMALAVTFILIVLSINAVSDEGRKVGELTLALVLSVLAGACICFDFKIPNILFIFLFFVFSAAALICMEFYTHVPWDLSIPVFLLNFVFYILLYGLWIAVLGSRWGCVAAPVIPMLAGLCNYYVVSFRSSPIVPWDIYSFGTAASITDNYSFSIDYRLLFVLMGFVFLMIFGEKTQFTIRKWKIRAAAVVFTILCMGGAVTFVQQDAAKEVFHLDDILFTPKVLYRNNGFAVAFFTNFRYLDVEKPEEYSADYAEKISKEYQGNPVATDGERPNILVIMNEAFADLSIYGDFDVSEDYLPFWNSLQDNTVRGDLYVSVKGGNTANSEFEFLTGNSMAFMPKGSVPYQQFIHGETPSLATHLKNLGYTTAALHPYYEKGWNRNKVYSYFDFESAYFKNDFTGTSTLRNYVDDRSAFNKIIELYEQKESEKPLFAFEITMQNHGGYSKEYVDLSPEIHMTGIPDEKKNKQIYATEKYLTLMKLSDDAFKEFIEYFQKQDEKTIVVMFGDHQPSDYIVNPVLRELGIDPKERDRSIDLYAKGYQVPFVIWANYDIDETDGKAISLNYFSSLLMDTAGLPKTGYQSYLTQLYKEFPVVTAEFFKRGDSDVFYKGVTSPEAYAEKNALNDYGILQYNDIIDTKKRIKNFF